MRTRGGRLLLLAALQFATAASGRGAEPVAEAAPSAPPLAATYKIDTGASTAGFTLGATMHTVTGIGRKVAGEFTLEPSGAGRWRVAGEVHVDAGSLDTGNIKRDFKMHNSTLEVTRYPLLRFSPATAAGALPEGLRAEAGSFPLKLSGKLEIRGVAREISLDVVATFRGSRLVVDGSFPISFLDWGVPDPSVFVLRVDKVLAASFHLEAIPTGG